MDTTTIICWNTRGLNGRAQHDSVRTLMQDVRLHIVCIVETKLQFLPQMLIASLLGMDFVDYAFVPAAGTCGGILVAAKQPDIRLSDVCVGCFSVSVLVHTGGDSERPLWWLTVVYGPQGDSEKELFLEELSAVRDACSGPWAILGDFNLILDEVDKNNDSINRHNMSRFRQTIADLELLDIHLHGRRYTWSNE